MLLFGSLFKAWYANGEYVHVSLLLFTIATFVRYFRFSSSIVCMEVIFILTLNEPIHMKINKQYNSSYLKSQDVIGICFVQVADYSLRIFVRNIIIHMSQCVIWTSGNRSRD